eukprot:gnl/TRDRNA2_/TRDRNA2_62518_c0_seq1.p1 gnl/TRDRNA2_/TRDRNA2_62518_c0~~gnl/TRDRNA2_/TRDRNA2_62518_c0_seq1.p1  ORF type:complete len:409 (+),score=65.84 gnl/TRDRNA2_/TRDRNA2_62518_c0_seq1:36-1229(+)
MSDAKRQRMCRPVRNAGGDMHGVTVSDHGEKRHWSGYWEEREAKLAAQPVDAQLYGSLSACLTSSTASSSAQEAEPGSAGGLPAKEDGAVAPQIFQHCRLYFNGRVDCENGLSSLALSKLARLHGAEVGPRLTKRRVTHVVCTQLSASKELKALRSAAAHAKTSQYFVLPSWITESVAARRRLNERDYSLLLRTATARGAGLSAPKFRTLARSVAEESSRGLLDCQRSSLGTDALASASMGNREPPASTAAMFVADSSPSSQGSRVHAEAVKPSVGSDRGQAAQAECIESVSSPTASQGVTDTISVAASPPSQSSEASPQCVALRCTEGMQAEPIKSVLSPSAIAGDASDGVPSTELDSDDVDDVTLEEREERDHRCVQHEGSSHRMWLQEVLGIDL